MNERLDGETLRNIRGLNEQVAIRAIRPAERAGRIEQPATAGPRCDANVERTTV